MPSYTSKDFRETNVNYINKDFTSLKNNLVEYAKVYFPSTYRDFNETSPGMMLIEMAAYVGDVLSFYIDQQYREMLLPLAEERRNVNNIAKTLGYKVKPIIPAFVNLTFEQKISDTGDGNSPDYTELVTVGKGTQVTSTSDSEIIFETLDIIDFTSSGSADLTISQTGYNDQGLTNEWTVTRKVRAVSGKTKTRDFTVGIPTKFLELTLADTDVIEIINIKDLNGNTWYEVDYLAQDAVPVETHYTRNERTSAYATIETPTTETLDLPVPYTLEFIRTKKRFIVETNDDNTTSIIFGNGILRSGQTLESLFQQVEQVGITIPGVMEDLTTSIDPTLGDDYATLGETPAHTTLSVTYRVGGGLSANVATGDLTTHNYIDTNSDNIAVTNQQPATGGSEKETIDETRYRAHAFFKTQNRCVTKQDYEARVMNLPAKFGSVSKIHVNRSKPIADQEGYVGSEVGTIDIYTLSYNNVKNLVTTPADPTGINIKNYLNQFRLITDDVNLRQGFIINFGVLFDVFAHKNANKQTIKLKCIQKIIDYFKIDNMQFRQPIYVSQLEYELMGIEGVRALNYVCITQDNNWQESGTGIGAFVPPLWYTKWSMTAGEESEGGWVNDGVEGQLGYGYKFDFQAAYRDGIILPSKTPAVFELKNPNLNIKGRVN